jgi:hypothetical protein
MSYDEYESNAVTEHLIDGVGGPVYVSDYLAFLEEVKEGRADGSTMLRLSNGQEKLVLELYANVGFLQGLERITALLKSQGKLDTINSERLIELRGIYTTALFTAALWKRKACVEFLIGAGATIKACRSWKLWIKKFESSSDEKHKNILKLLKEQLEKENV